jgi:hypothetical protein
VSTNVEEGVRHVGYIRVRMHQLDTIWYNMKDDICMLTGAVYLS